MITKNEKNKIVQVLGTHYAPKVLAHLNELEIKNANGSEFSLAGIRNIVNGRDNKAIETAILNLVIKTERQNIKDQRRRREMLENK